MDQKKFPFLFRYFSFNDDSQLFKTTTGLARAKIPSAKPVAAKKDKPESGKEKSPVAQSPSSSPAEEITPMPFETDPAKRLSMPNPCNNRLIQTANLIQASASFDVDIPNAEIGKVVTRFPPEASGYLHIGHIKAAMLNEYYARHFQGKLLLRFDDTNPAKEKQEFEEAIKNDLKSCGVYPDQLTYTSDYFDFIIHMGTKMLEMDKAYMDDLPVDVMRDNRMKEIESPMRNNTIEQNLKLWEEMKTGSKDGMKFVMRAKIDMHAKNTALRDPVMFRCVNKPHARTGDKYKVYPSYDFACPIVDSIEGVTVSMRTIEYRDRNEQYAWFQTAMDLRPVPIYDFARLNFMFTEMSKRKLQWFVDEGIAEGWFDPRFPTVQGVMRRGMTIPALRAFVYEQGPSRNITYQEWDKIWMKNKQVIDPIAPRYTAVEVENAVKVTLIDGPAEPYQSIVPRNRKNPAVGDKLVEFSRELIIDQADAELLKVGNEVTLMGWGNIIIESVTKDESRLIPSAASPTKGAAKDSPAESVLVPVVTGVTAKMNLAGDFKKTKLKITWISAPGDSLGTLPKATCVCFDHLLTKPKLELEDKFEDFVNRKSKFSCEMFVEPSATHGVVGDIVQFERKGYFFLDKPFDSTVEHSQATFHYIPEGRQMLMKIGGRLPA